MAHIAEQNLLTNAVETNPDLVFIPERRTPTIQRALDILSDTGDVAPAFLFRALGVSDTGPDGGDRTYRDFVFEATRDDEAKRAARANPNTPEGKADKALLKADRDAEKAKRDAKAALTKAAHDAAKVEG